MDPQFLIETSLYFLALINPISKVFLLSSMEPPIKTHRELFKLSVNATLVASAILFTLTLVGIFLFSSIFRINIYSLQIAGGGVLLMVGLTAVRRGVFYEKQDQMQSHDFSIVPLAAPLIAGPGTIAGAISFSSERGANLTLISISIALFLNFLLMLSSLGIGSFLRKIHAAGPLIRISGLIVAAVAVQMILNGAGAWLSTVR